MKKIGIFFGSDTGNTEYVAKLIQKEIGKKKSVVKDIAFVKKKEIDSFKNLIFGTPTWYYGELQSDWDEFLPILKSINVENKKIALFGCGDQEDYSEYFCDGIAKIFFILKKNKAKIIGEWSTKGYIFEKSKALINKKKFMGLIIDEDRQSKLTKDRIKRWTKKLLVLFKK